MATLYIGHHYGHSDMAYYLWLMHLVHTPSYTYTFGLQCMWLSIILAFLYSPVLC